MATTATTALSAAGTAIGRVRYSIVVMLFLVTVVNYADRAVIAIAGPAWRRDAPARARVLQP